MSVGNFLAFVGGGLLQGAGTGIVEQARQLREDARQAADRKAREDNIVLTADLQARNQKADDDRRTESSITLAREQGSITRSNAEFENGLIMERQDAQIRLQADMAEIAAARAAARDRQEVKDVFVDSKGDAYVIYKNGDKKNLNLKQGPRLGDNGFTPGETRLIKAAEAGATKTDDEGVKRTESADVARNLYRQGRPDLAALYDSQYAKEGKFYQENGRAPKPGEGVEFEGKKLWFVGKGGGRPTDTAAPATRQRGAAAPTGVSGAKQAPDGNWYVPDPNRPGKYLRVE